MKDLLTRQSQLMPKHEQDADAVASRADELLTGRDPVRTFGAKFGFDFRNVRVHADGDAALATQALGARAYTIGDHVTVGSGQMTRHTLAHELAHVVAQRGGGKSGDLAISAAPQGAVQCQPATTLGQGGGLSGVMSRDRARVQRQMQEMHFFHGTSWEIARKMPGNIMAVGGGDFAIGFYTHWDRDNKKAKNRAISWGCRQAKEQGEPYAGVLDFLVQRPDFDALLGPGKSLGFGLTSLDQADYQDKQRKWLDFITTHGREKNPEFVQDPKEPKGQGDWRHPVLPKDKQTQPQYNIITGPMYTRLRGQESREPGRDEFRPYAEGRDLPQQVVWAKVGVDLLNSNRVKTTLEQYDADTRDPISPHQQTPPGPTRAAKQTDAVQLEPVQPKPAPPPKPLIPSLPPWRRMGP